MKARAVRRNHFTHTVEIRGGEHTITADEPKKNGGDDQGPSPQELLAASLASCSAVTLEMYADRKGWDLGGVTVSVNYEPAQRGSPTRFEIDVKLPQGMPEDQRERLMQIVARCPVHRTLEGEVIFEEKLTLA
jgi:putative redox protein